MDENKVTKWIGIDTLDGPMYAAEFKDPLDESDIRLAHQTHLELWQFEKERNRQPLKGIEQRANFLPV